jgi:HlyD family secretion protein
MQVNANIDEADVGRIRPGQHVTFRVDAYPTDTFEGTVSQIRLQPVVVSNVTTYGTVIDVPNAQLKLKPGMTANVKVEIAKRTDVLRVPTAALRFRPSTDVFAALNQPVPPEALASPGSGRGGRGGFGRGGAGGAVGATPPAAPAGAAPSTTAPAATAPPVAAPSRSTATAPAPSSEGALRGGRGGGFGGSGQAGDAAGGQGGERRAGGRGFDPARMMERFKGMSSDEQKQFIARMKDRGQDTSLFEKEIQANAKPAGKGKTTAAAQTIDALFAPLPTVESRGRVWLCLQCDTPGGRTLKSVNLRLGVSDGTNTELLGGELQQNMEVVTSVAGLSATTRTQPGANPMNPLMPGGGRGPGGFGGPGGGRGR